MKYDLVKYERGQVWMIRHKNPNNTAYGHEQMKDRPWLILSVGKFNQSSKMITAVPITTREYVITPSQVLFENERGQKNVILCEQVRAFDYSSGAYIFDFLGNISREILEKVDVAISIHLGLHYSPITLKSLYDSMEAIIKSVGYMQQRVDTPKFTDKDVQEFADKLRQISATTETPLKHPDIRDSMDKAYGIPIEENDEVAATAEDKKITSTEVYISSEYDRVDTLPAQDVGVSIPLPEVVKKSPRISWTKENCEEFLRDAATMPMKQVMEKWNILKKTRFYSTKNYVQRVLEEKTL